MYKIQGYKTSSGQICLMSCISDVFIQYGLEVNESVIFALAEASLFYYKHFDIEEAQHNNRTIKLFDLVMGGIRYDTSLMINNVIKYFGIKIDIDSSLEVTETKDFIEKHINKQQPILSLLSREYLGYMDKKLRDSITHSINIIGYDWKSNDLYVSDTYIPTNPVTSYEGILPFEEYNKSLVSSKDIFKKKFIFRNIAFVPEDSAFSSLDTETLLKPLKNIAYSFLKDECSENGILTGLKGYRQFLSDYEEWMILGNDPIVSNLFKFVHHRVTNFGGPVVTNKLLAEYMDYLNMKEHNSKFLKLKDIFLDLNKKWFVIANLFGKYSFFINEKSKSNLHQKFVDTIQLEESVYHMISEM